GYADAAPWPSDADGGGYSLVLIHPEGRPDPANPANWRAGVVAHGTPGGTDADSFGAWADRLGVSPDPEADDDGNGLSLLMEYGLGLMPGAPADGVFAFSMDPAGRPAMTFPRAAAADDVAMQAEMSVDLVNWTVLNGVPGDTGNSGGSGSRHMTFVAVPPAGAASVFLRAAARMRPPFPNSPRHHP